MIILVLGDFHIPTRASKIPSKINELIRGRRFDLILSTGDFTDRGVLNELMKIGPVRWVVGNMDYLSGPTELRLEIGKFKFGLFHGTGIYPRGDLEKLFKKAKEMNVNVLVTGHTHAQSINLYRGVLILNPGSVTGVPGGGPASLKPSLMILEVEENKLKVLGFEVNSRLRVNEKRFELVENEVIETS